MKVSINDLQSEGFQDVTKIFKDVIWVGKNNNNDYVTLHETGKRTFFIFTGWDE